ncbi:MAG: DNA repair protein RecN [Candidatus Marinimicrobia bacterium]|nr:DNA repair protein RecN [Candidatus Neomarinimicrobiota bacterium]
MLKRLKIKDFQLFESADIEFGSGLNVITGETGSGKSMLINAINVLLGKRASTDVVRKGARESSVEAEFSLSAELADNLNIEPGDEKLDLSRIVNATGRSKSILNGSTITAGTVQAISKHLIDLHGQHEHQSLLDSKRHVEFVDASGELNELRGKVKYKYLETKAAKAALDLLLERKRLIEEKRELLEFKMKEFNETAPQEGETDALEEEVRLLEHGETMVSKSRELAEILYEKDFSLYEQIESVRGEIQELARIDDSLNEQTKEAASASITLKEMAGFFANYADKVDLDPQRLEQVRERLSALISLALKYGGNEASMLLEYEKTRSEYESIESVGEESKDALEKFRQLKTELSALCLSLSAKRTRASKQLSSDIVDSMKGLGIENSRFRVESSYSEDEKGWIEADGKKFLVDEQGMDNMEFYISTNPGEDLKPLSKVASGGEISRIMLAIKAILADKDKIPVLIFDEIDIGISGRVAEAVGNRLKELSKYHQLICITHLPQIAGKADNHYLVEKHVKEGRTFALVRELDDAQRKEAVASLLAGSEITAAARKQAEDMIG